MTTRRPAALKWISTAAGLLAADCTGTQTRIDQQGYRVPLDADRVVVFTEIVRTDPSRPGPASNFAQLRLEVLREGEPAAGGIIAQAEFERPADTRGFLRAGDHFDLYTDVTRQKIWLVKSGTGDVFASLDCQTGKVTGPGDTPPAWAALAPAVLLGR